MNNSVEKYLELGYSMRITPDPELGFFAEIPDLPGCVGDGNTIDDAVADLHDSMKVWLEHAIEKGQEIPPPREDSDYSGHFALRMPSSLHRAVSEEAEEEGVSINLYLNTLITENRHIRSVKQIQRKYIEKKSADFSFMYDLLSSLHATIEASVTVKKPTEIAA